MEAPGILIPSDPPFISSDKFEQYLKLGRHAIDEFFGAGLPECKPFVYRVEPEKR